MAAPRPVSISQQQNMATTDDKSVNVWTSFDESPFNSGGPAQGENGWTTFLDASHAAIFMEPDGSQLGERGLIGVSSAISPKTAANSPVQKEQHGHPCAVNPELRATSESSLQLGSHSFIAPQMTSNLLPAQYPQADTYKHGRMITAHGLNNFGGLSVSHISPMPSLSQATLKRPESVHSSSMGPYLHSTNANHSSSHMHIHPNDGLPRIHRQLSSENSSLVKSVNEHDPWCVTEEQRNYYMNQFAMMQPALSGKIDGQTARNFFTKSRLPIPELSHIWELCDMDQDGHLTLDEFCAAFHLVVARKNGYELPSSMPLSLLPSLVGVSDVDEERQGVQVRDSVKDSCQSEMGLRAAKSQEKWETFSDRTSSSTTLANFDQDPQNMESLAHPIALRVTPSRHQAHSARILANTSPVKSTDEGDSSPPYQVRIPIQHRSLTNPYGSLTNDFSETDNGSKKSKLTMDHRRACSTSSASSSSGIDPTPSPAAGRRSKASSHSSCGTSDRSSSEVEISYHPPENNQSDQECSDWSSRPLRPRSGSDSSVDGPPLQNCVLSDVTTDTAPIPPPRLTQSQDSRIDIDDQVFEKNLGEGTNQSEPLSESAPIPPPRSELSLATKLALHEVFADFSQFDKKIASEHESSKEPSNVSAPPRPGMSDKTSCSGRTGGEDTPVPAPRHASEEKSRKNSAEEKDDKEKVAHRKAPTKPPRSRILSVASSRPDEIQGSTEHSMADAELKLQQKPNQEESMSKTVLQRSIRDLKLCNSQLTQMNAELQQELKDVMQSRITIEMSIHQLRPFSQ